MEDFKTRIVALIETYTKDSKGNQNDDVADVLYYIMTREQLMLDTILFVLFGKVPEPTSFATHVNIVLGLESDMILNNLVFKSHEQSIRAAMKQSELAIHSMLTTLANDGYKDENRHMLEAILSNRFSAMSVVISLCYGMEAAKTFDIELRALTQVMPQEIEALRNYGNRGSDRRKLSDSSG